MRPTALCASGLLDSRTGVVADIKSARESPRPLHLLRRLVLRVARLRSFGAAGLVLVISLLR
jgi:hypothetical protein